MIIGPPLKTSVLYDIPISGWWDFLMNDLNRLLGWRAELETILGKSVSTSIKVHGLFVPASALQSRLNKFSQNLVLFTHVEQYQVQLIGSATGLFYCDTKFIICTGHQVKDFSRQDVGIIVPNENQYISSAGYTQFLTHESPQQSDAGDLCAFDFTPQTTSNQDLGGRFFQLSSDDFLSDKDEDNVVAYLAYGSPFVDQKYNIVDENRVGLVVRSITCKPDSQPSDIALGRCRALSPMDFDPNGLSGGPVFATVLKGLELVLKFAGIINRSGNGRIHFIKGKAVQKLLDHTIGKQSNP